MVSMIVRYENSWHTRTLKAAADQIGMDLDVSRLYSEDQDFKTIVSSLADTIFVFKFNTTRTHSLFFYEEILKQNKPVINAMELHRPYIRSQFYQQTKLRQQTDLALIPTFMWRKHKHLMKSLREGLIDFPIIGKPEYGSLGRGVKRFSTIDELDAFDKGKIGEYVFQPFIENDGDYRVFVIQDRAIAIMKRVPQAGMYVNNIKRGASAHAVKDASLRSELEDIAVQATKALSLDYSGVDIIYDKNASVHRVIEVNTSPLWKATQTVASKNIAEELMDFAWQIDNGKAQPRTPNTPPIV